MWRYEITERRLTDPQGTVRATGHGTAPPYSGHEEGLNNPEKADVREVGPLPPGVWRIGDPFTHPQRGPVVMRLAPQPGTEVFGRDGFLIHGDNSAGNESASLGCLILARPDREAIAASPDRLLEVLP